MAAQWHAHRHRGHQQSLYAGGVGCWHQHHLRGNRDQLRSAPTVAISNALSIQRFHHRHGRDCCAARCCCWHRHSVGRRHHRHRQVFIAQASNVDAVGTVSGGAGTTTVTAPNGQWWKFSGTLTNGSYVSGNPWVYCACEHRGDEEISTMPTGSGATARHGGMIKPDFNTFAEAQWALPTRGDEAGVRWQDQRSCHQSVLDYSCRPVQCGVECTRHVPDRIVRAIRWCRRCPGIPRLSGPRSQSGRVLSNGLRHGGRLHPRG